MGLPATKFHKAIGALRPGFGGDGAGQTLGQLGVAEFIGLGEMAAQVPLADGSEYRVAAWCEDDSVDE